MDSTLAMTLASWLGTYLLHSTVLLGMAFLLQRLWRVPSENAEILWRVALFGGFATALVQTNLGLGLWSIATSIPTDPAPASPLRLDAPLESAPALTLVSSVATVATPPQAVSEHTVWDAASCLRFLLAVWVGGVVGLWVLHGGRRLRLQRRLADRVALSPGPLLVCFGELARRAGMPPGIRLTTSSRIRCPMAFGILRPEVCLPAGLAADMDFDQQGCVLAHELFHLRARDPLWLLLQAAAVTVGFLQPLNRLAVRHLRELAEFRCDAWAVRLCGSRLRMANALMTVAESYAVASQAVPAYAGVNAMAVAGSALRRRVERILAKPGTPSKVGRCALLASVVVGLVAVALAVPGVALGATPRGGPAGGYDSGLEPGIVADPRLRTLRRLEAPLGNLQSDLEAIRARLEGSAYRSKVLPLVEKLEHRLRQLQTEQRVLQREVIVTVRAKQHFHKPDSNNRKR